MVSVLTLPGHWWSARLWYTVRVEVSVLTSSGHWWSAGLWYTVRVRPGRKSLVRHSSSRVMSVPLEPHQPAAPDGVSEPEPHRPATPDVIPKHRTSGVNNGTHGGRGDMTLHEDSTGSSSGQVIMGREHVKHTRTIFVLLFGNF